MKWTHFFAVGFTVVSLFALSVDARPGGRGGPHGKKRMHRQGVMKELNLTQEQRQKMRELRQQHRAGMKGLRSQMRQARESMKKAFQENSSEGQLRTLHNKLMDLQKSVATKRFENLLEVRKILTPEQRKKFRMPGSRTSGPPGDEMDAI